eukprot:291065-Prymnesium_polylepis.1
MVCSESIARKSAVQSVRSYIRSVISAPCAAIQKSSIRRRRSYASSGPSSAPASSGSGSAGAASSAAHASGAAAVRCGALRSTRRPSRSPTEP